jgi:hypothetical protein
MSDISRDEFQEQLSDFEERMADKIAKLKGETQSYIDGLRRETQAGSDELGGRMQSRLDTLRTETQARIDAVVATLQARVDSLRTEAQARTDEVGTRQQTRTDNLRTDTEARINGVEGIFRNEISGLRGAMEARIDGLRPGWVQRNSPGISAAAALLALLVGGWYYITQVGLTKNSLQNNLVYQMQKDQRAAIVDFASGRSGPEYIFADMQSIFIQHNLGTIPPDVWPLFVRDFCGLMTREIFRRTWDDISATGAFSKAFISFVDQVKDEESPECKGETK